MLTCSLSVCTPLDTDEVDIVSIEVSTVNNTTNVVTDIISS